MPFREQTVLFLDILGFSYLTEVAETGPYQVAPPMFPTDARLGDHEVFPGSSPSAYPSYHFHRSLEQWLQLYAEKSIPLTAMTFSDSAFVVTAADAIGRIARHVMRDCLLRKIPVRMGIASGTFRTIRFRADSANQVQIYGAQFYGIGIVRAHEAEQKAGKGLRIFVHPSVQQNDLRMLTRNGASRLMDLETPTDAAHGELEYLSDHGGKPWSGSQVNEEECRDLWTKLNQMQQEALELPSSIRERVQLHYVETLAAFDRMCDALKIPRFSAVNH